MPAGAALPERGVAPAIFLGVVPDPADQIFPIKLVEAGEVGVDGSRIAVAPVENRLRRLPPGADGGDDALGGQRIEGDRRVTRGEPAVARGRAQRRTAGGDEGRSSQQAIVEVLLDPP